MMRDDAPDIAARLAATRVLPMVTLTRAEDAGPLARALLAGGIDMFEITFRSAAAAEAIRQAVAVDGMCVGAGTVTDAAQWAQAREAGAAFIVSPGATPALYATAAGDPGLALLPGVATASEIMAAREAGHRVMKFFPAATMGGAASLRAFAGPFADVRFCPTGGIGPANMADYLGLANVIAVGGSWLAPADAIAGGDWTRITMLARQARATAGAAG